jgi:hypothetical protein
MSETEGPPPFEPSARTIRIEDIDRGVVDFFARVVAAHALFPDGARRLVPVKFSSGERWVSSADRAGIRDRNGQLILPIIQVRRLGLDALNNKTALGANVPRMQVSRLVSEKTSELRNLDQSRPISMRRLRGAAVYDVYTVPFPSNNNFPYTVRIQTQTQTQMNEILEKLLTRLEFFNVPSFVISLAGETRQVGIKQGVGDAELLPEDHSEFEERKPLDNYYCVGYIEGKIDDQGNLDEFTDQERILQLQFNFTVPTVLMLDPEGERPAVQVQRTAFALSLGSEEVHVIDDPAEADRIFGRPK